MKEILSDRLKEERSALLDYLIAKFRNEDWHGVQDAASDLRDIDCQLEIITMWEEAECRLSQKP